MHTVTFTVHSRFAEDQEPFTGCMLVGDMASNVQVLEEIFARGGNHPGMTPFEGWAQPSVSVGDTVRFHWANEGVAAIYTYRCENVGWKEIEDESTETIAAMARFAAVNPIYAEAFAAAKARQVALRDRIAARRAGLAA